MANSAPHLNPAWVDKDVTNSNAVNAIAARYGTGALAQPAPGSTFTWAGGVYPGDSSGTTISDYQCTQTTPSATMAALVQAGQAQVYRSLGGPYQGTSTASFTVAIGAANTSPRIDYLVMRFRDIGLDSSGSAVATYAPIVLPGTPSGSPVEPTGSLTDGDLLIAAVTVRANTTSILTSDISDRRVFNTARGGIYPKSSTDTRNGAYAGHTRYNLTSGSVETWDGSAWQVIAAPYVWSSFTPTLTYQGAGGGGSGSPGTVNLGTGGTALGRYLQVGKTLSLRYVFNGGTSPNGGSGSIYTVLPGSFVSAMNGETQILAKLNTPATSGIWNGVCFIPANSTQMFLYFPNSQSDNRLNQWMVANSPGVTGTGVPAVAGQLSNPSVLVVQGIVEVQ